MRNLVNICLQNVVIYHIVPSRYDFPAVSGNNLPSISKQTLCTEKHYVIEYTIPLTDKVTKETLISAFLLSQNLQKKFVLQKKTEEL